MTDPIDDRTAAREAALLAALADGRRLARPEDYLYDKAQEKFWDTQDNTLHGESAVDASIPLELWRVVVEEPPPDPPEGRGRGRTRQRRERLIKPSVDILRVENDQFVEGATWWPGKDQIIRDWFIDNNGFYPARGRRIYNQYRPPPDWRVNGGNASSAWPWVEHVKRLWPVVGEHEYFFDYCAHMVQHPDVKCNAAIVLSGTQGIGKDAALAPVRTAVGTWNSRGIDPDHLFSQYNPYVQTLMLVIDEVRPSKDEFRASAMYNLLKTLIVAPPETLPLRDLYTKTRYVVNLIRVFITTNDWLSMYVPGEDRRMFIMHSELKQKWHEAAGLQNYFVDFFGWLASGGMADVAAWLGARDLSRFNPKDQPDKTAGWEAVANTWAAPDDAVSQALEILGSPDIVFGAEMAEVPFDGREELVGMLKSPRKIGHRMQQDGYVMLRPQEAGATRWSYIREGGIFRSKVVFIKSGAFPDKAKIVPAVNEKGYELASRRRADGRVTPLRRI